VTVDVPVVNTTVVLVTVPSSSESGSVELLVGVAVTIGAAMTVTPDGEAAADEAGGSDAGGSAAGGSEEDELEAGAELLDPSPFTVILSVWSKEHGEISVAGPVFPPTYFPPNWTDWPGLGYTISTFSGVMQVPPKILASCIRGPVKEVEEDPETLTGAQFI
jgi:hypothetical protein